MRFNCTTDKDGSGLLAKTIEPLSKSSLHMVCCSGLEISIRMHLQFVEEVVCSLACSMKHCCFTETCLHTSPAHNGLWEGKIDISKALASGHLVRN